MTPQVETAPYGTWKSPITRELISGKSNSFKEVHVDVNLPHVSHGILLGTDLAIYIAQVWSNLPD